jgi:hypothetical protein
VNQRSGWHGRGWGPYFESMIDGARAGEMSEPATGCSRGVGPGSEERDDHGRRPECARPRRFGERRTTVRC